MSPTTSAANGGRHRSPSMSTGRRHSGFGVTFRRYQVRDTGTDSRLRTAPQTMPGRTLARRRLSTQEFPTFDGL